MAKALIKLIVKMTNHLTTNRQLQQTPIAIIGMASIFPQAKNLQEYWEKIVGKVDCITDVPASRWNVENYYDPDPKAPDKSYCKRGGFIPEVDFNPLEFGLPPKLLEATDISQLLSLVVAKGAMADAGYGNRAFVGDRTGVILGTAVGKPLSNPLSARLEYPIWQRVLRSSGLSDDDTEKIVEKIKAAYVQWEENSFPGMLSNVIAGRIANRLDLGGTNCVIDAACASSLAAVKMAVSELLEHRCDMMLSGGVDIDGTIFTYLCFSKTPAFSKNQQIRPFDQDADGMIVGEGIGMLVLKRLEDARRDNDRIYAVIKGIGSSSDGRYKSIYAPNVDGQVKALRRAYEEAGCSPTGVSLIEAHGTGTKAGDQAEFAALKAVFRSDEGRSPHIALGSVKSQIGHTKAAAGAASLIKTALSLHHKILPPTINVSKANPKLGLETSPFYLNTQTRPWFSGAVPRRAGVSSFGFGGTNYHLVLEEWNGVAGDRLHHTPQSVLLFAPTRMQLLARCEEILDKLRSDGARDYGELINHHPVPLTSARVGFVANSLAQTLDKLQTTVQLLQTDQASWEHPAGIYYRQSGMALEGKVVALFSGQGSQYLEMGRELTINFPCLRQAYERMNSHLSADGLPPISEVVFPPSVEQDTAKLQRTEYAQPAIGVFSFGLYKLLQQAGFIPNFIAGHSFGELTALWAASVIGDEDYFYLVKARGQAMATPDGSNDAGTMIAVKEDVSKVEQAIAQFPSVAIANINSPRQVVLAGAKSKIAAVQQVLHKRGYSLVELPVSAAFHTPLVGYAQKPFAKAVEAVTFRSPKIPVYSNTTGERYPHKAQAIQRVLKDQIPNSVLFQQEIERIHADGGYCFVEFGPRSILTNLVTEILGDRPHLAIALNPSRQKDSDYQLREAIIQLRVAGLPLNVDQVQPGPAVKPSNVHHQHKQVLVRLNGANYLSEQTKSAFEQALQDGHQVHLSASDLNAPDNGHQVPSFPPELASATATTPQQTEPPMKDQRLLESLESSLEQINQYQKETLHLHHQYLNYQIEATKIFFHLIQQQSNLLANGNGDRQIAETNAMMQSLERGLIRFQDHQAETLRVHERSLNDHSEYVKNFFQLIQSQLLLEGANFHQVKPSQTEEPAAQVKQAEKYTLETSDREPDKAEPTFQNASPWDHKEPATQAKPDLALNKVKPDQRSPETISSEINLIEENLTTTAQPITVSEAIPTFSQTLLEVVSEKTGYPPEMLDLDMDLEADLGIDSIKRIEILAAMQEFPDVPQIASEELADLRTLRQIVEYINSLVPQGSPQSASPAKVQVLQNVILNSDGNGSELLPEMTTAKETSSFSQTLLKVVSEKTGYPPEMLDLDMDRTYARTLDVEERER